MLYTAQDRAVGVSRRYEGKLCHPHHAQKTAYHHVVASRVTNATQHHTQHESETFSVCAVLAACWV